MNKQKMRDEVQKIFNSDFSTYPIERVPDGTDHRLRADNTGFEGEFAFLNVFFQGSSTLNGTYPLKTIGKIYNAFHHCMVACIHECHGKVRTFDGDRITGVFSGEDKINEAVVCANYMVGCYVEILEPKIKTLFNTDDFEIGVGVCTGKALVIKSPVGSNGNTKSLLWVGEATNIGDKLSENINVWNGRINICARCFQKLSQENRYHIDKDGNKTPKWTQGAMDYQGSLIDIYRSTWYYVLS